MTVLSFRTRSEGLCQAFHIEVLSYYALLISYELTVCCVRSAELGRGISAFTLCLILLQSSPNGALSALCIPIRPGRPAPVNLGVGEVIGDDELVVGKRCAPAIVPLIVAFVFKPITIEAQSLDVLPHWMC